MLVEREVAGLRRSRLRRGLVLRDSPVAASGSPGVPISPPRRGSTQREPQARRHGTTFLEGLYGVLTSAGPIPVRVADIEWREEIRGRRKGQALAVSRAFYSQPRFALFGALPGCGRRHLERRIIEVFGFDLAEVFAPRSHRLLRLDLGRSALAGLMARAPHNFAIPRPRVLARHHRSRDCARSSGPTFLAFVVIQVRYLFGGAGRVAATAGLTYAEYARRGFFELVTVNTPLAPLLLTAHWLPGPRPAPTSSVWLGACRHNGNPALRRRGLRAAANVLTSKSSV